MKAGEAEGRHTRVQAAEAGRLYEYSLLVSQLGTATVCNRQNVGGADNTCTSRGLLAIRSLRCRFGRPSDEPGLLNVFGLLPRSKESMTRSFNPTVTQPRRTGLTKLGNVPESANFDDAVH